MDMAGRLEGGSRPARARIARGGAAACAMAIGLCLTAASLYAAAPIDDPGPGEAAKVAFKIGYRTD